MDSVGVTATDRPFANCTYLMFIQEFVQLLYPDEKKIIPLGAVNVSVAQRNFRIGVAAQEFVPRNCPLSPDSYYTYQMITPNVQLTYYNENGTAHLAGFTFYPTTSEPVIPYLHIEDQAIRYALMLAEPFPLANRSRNLNFKRFKKYGRQCGAAGRRVVVFAEDGQRAVHWDYDFWHRKKNLVACEECARDFESYGFEEEVEEMQESASLAIIPKSTDSTYQLINFHVETKDESESNPEI